MVDTVVVRDVIAQRVDVCDQPTRRVDVIAAGPAGAAGAGLSIAGVFVDLVAFLAAHPTGAIGDAYLVGDDLYVWDVTNSVWFNAGPLRGASGADGRPGQIRFTGEGAPGTIIGSQPADTYLDRLTGDIYTLL